MNLLIWFLFLLSPCAAFQVPLPESDLINEHRVSLVESPNHKESLDALASIPSDTHALLKHPEFPRHQVRIKRATFCDPSVRTFTGYIDVGVKHIFFYFFESRNDPANDDVILWTNGGPGGSAALGMLAELGPCNIVSPNETVYNPHSWNSNANIFFIDQPVGVGFSYSDTGDVPSTSESSAKDIAAFCAIFFEFFEQFRDRPFHLSGESYAGRYLPVYAAEIVDQNARLRKANFSTVNLKSVMIGNGATDHYTLFESYYDIQCTNASLPPVQTIKTCVRIKQAVPRCLKMYKTSCIDQFDLMGCQASLQFCQLELLFSYVELGLNPYDMSTTCDDPFLGCVPGANLIGPYLNQPHIRKELGIDAGFGDYEVASDAVALAFHETADMAHQTQVYVAELLARGVKVLIYAGTYDFICNWVGNERWTLAMEWFGQESFAKTPLIDWTIDGEVAGKTRSAYNLTFATVYGGGHTLPHDKPYESLVLINRWLNGTALLESD